MGHAAAGLCLALSAAGSAASSMWEIGRLDYAAGGSEIAAFVNIGSDVQLQNILCTRRQTHASRFSLLLPRSSERHSIIELEIDADGRRTTAYGEISGNTLELQVDSDIIISLTHSPNLVLAFRPEDAAALGVEQVLEVPMQGAAFANTHIASECTVQCQNHRFSCLRPLVSAILWPVGGFERETADLDELCTTGSPRPEFRLTQRCRTALDEFYERHGRGPLTFMHELFFPEDAAFRRYVAAWNALVSQLGLSEDASVAALADEREWYMILFSLLSDAPLQNYPSSYHRIRGINEDPTTLIYDIDNRYEMETLKYVAVLLRRPGMQAAQPVLLRALNAWNEFYREFSAAIPSINHVRALRPVMYRQMLMRIWELAGRPHGLELREENQFVQGTNGRPVTDEPLEQACSIFDGMRGDQFYFGSADCVQITQQQLRNQGFVDEGLRAVQQRWDEYEASLSQSVFAPGEEAEGSHPQANLTLVLLTLFKRYGFGDYFLVRECISSQDEDICYLERQRAAHSYLQELNNRTQAIAAVSQQDAQELARLSDLFEAYQEQLDRYLDSLAERRKIEHWKISLALAVSLIAQTGSIMNAPYYREQLNSGDELIGEDDFELVAAP